MIGKRKKAVAKNDFHVLMVGDRFSNFIEGHVYDLMEKDDCVILIDEDKFGNQFNKKEFHENFEIIS